MQLILQWLKAIKSSRKQKTLSNSCMIIVSIGHNQSKHQDTFNNIKEDIITSIEIILSSTIIG